LHTHRQPVPVGTQRQVGGWAIGETKANPTYGAQSLVQALAGGRGDRLTGTRLNLISLDG
jgi:hypothetical protein